MKYCLSLLTVLLFFALPVNAGDIDLPASGDLWDNWNTNQDFYGQDKPFVSEEDFEKAIDSKNKKNKNWFGLKKRNKNIPKGEERNNYSETEIYEPHEQSNAVNTLPVICIPVELSVGEGILPVGHYQVKGEKDGDKVVLNLYQAQFLMAKIPAIETTEDFGEDEILFVKWVPDGDYKMKILYGSMDFNAYAYVDIK